MATISFQNGTDSYSGCIDMYLHAGAPNNTQASDAALSIYYLYGSLIGWDISSIGEATISSVTIDLYCDYFGGGTRTINVWRVLKPYTNDATYNDWDSPDLEWGSSGCNSASDSGGYNETDAGGYDRFSTADTTKSITGAGAMQIASSAGLVATAQSALDNGKRCAWLFRLTDGDANLSSSENTTVSHRPKLTIEYNASGATGNPWYYFAQMRKKLEDKLKRRIILPGFADVMTYGYAR